MNSLVTILWVVLPDTSGHPLHVRPLLLILEKKKVLLTIGFLGSWALKILEVQEQFVFNVYGVLYFDFVDCIQKPGYPGRSIFFLKSAKKS